MATSPLSSNSESDIFAFNQQQNLNLPSTSGGRLLKTTPGSTNTETVVLCSCQRKMFNASPSEANSGNQRKRSNGESSSTTKRKKKSKTSKICNGETTQDQFNKNILKCFINSNISLHVINDKFFKKIFKGLNITAKGLDLITQRSLTDLIEDYNEREIRAIKHDLSNAKSVRTTFTIWPANTIYILEVTANWLDSNLQLKRKTLAYRVLSHPSKIEVVLRNLVHFEEFLTEIHAKFGIEHQKVLISKKGGCNLIKMFLEFALDIENTICRRTDKDISQLPSETQPSTLVSNLTFTTVKSISQNTETRIKDVFKQVIEKCTNLWNCIGQPEFDKIIQRITGRTIGEPTLGWSNLYHHLKQIASIKDEIPQLYKELKLKNDFNDNDFKFIAEYLLCLNPIAEAVNKIQDESFTRGMFLPCLVSLRNKLIKLNKVPFVLCKKLAETYLEIFETRFLDYLKEPSRFALDLAIAALAHPEFKDNWIKCLAPECESKIRDLFKEKIVENIQDLSETSQKDAFFDFDIVNVDGDLKKDKLKQLKADSIINRYLGDQDRDLNMLRRYPEIHRVFKKYNDRSAMICPLLPDFETMHLLLRENLLEKRLLLKSNLCK